MNRELIRAAAVIARRDYVATVFSKAFIFFLLGPLLPVAAALLFGSVSGGGGGGPDAPRARLAIQADAVDAQWLVAARVRLANKLGAGGVPDLLIVAPRDGDPARMLDDPAANVGAVLTGGFAAPRLAGPPPALGTFRSGAALLLDEARLLRAVGRTQAVAPVPIAERATAAAPPDEAGGRKATARTAQLVLMFLTLLLSGMLISNMLEEKSNKVVEVLAAAVPIDAIFLGKLVAMLGVSLSGIVVWGLMAAVAIVPRVLDGVAVAAPAMGWPGFALLALCYYCACYLLLGAVFLGIGAQASTAREVQTLSMPVTMAQVGIVALASRAVDQPDGPLGIGAAIFPWSSPFAMLARAAQSPALWPHLAALAWQGTWIVLILWTASRLFRLSVLKSGGGLRAIFGRSAARA